MIANSLIQMMEVAASRWKQSVPFDPELQLPNLFLNEAKEVINVLSKAGYVLSSVSDSVNGIELVYKKARLEVTIGYFNGSAEVFVVLNRDSEFVNFSWHISKKEWQVRLRRWMPMPQQDVIRMIR